jgi:integrin beta 3
MTAPARAAVRVAPPAEPAGPPLDAAPRSPAPFDVPYDDAPYEAERQSDRGLHSASPAGGNPAFDLGPDAPRVSVDPILTGGREIRTGRRAEISHAVREVRRLRTATIVLVVLAVLGAPLAFYAVREVARDPVFVELSALEVPSWAARDPRDEASGSRWCIRQCRFRQRIWRSERNAEETSAVYTRALTTAGWRPWRVAGCPQEGVEGFETCWQRDEYVLDLWVYLPDCEVQLKAPDPSASGAAATGPQAEAVCPPTVVTMKVVNRVAFRPPAG